ncbi:MAG TPA: tetratricopeptide repeat protein, partial [Aliiroseovarius sp.]|nr:tetratricopeptide repeat protein [Aliiroseovarius sp.]
AVNARPNDGYIADSLGWVLYRLGRYDEAVGPMERAVQLTPIDPVINDHLGDVYWAVGRTREAEFQWKRALSFDPEEKELERIRRKLEVGLDMVLEEEGTKPLTPANGG